MMKHNVVSVLAALVMATSASAYSSEDEGHFEPGSEDAIEVMHCGDIGREAITIMEYRQTSGKRFDEVEWGLLYGKLADDPWWEDVNTVRKIMFQQAYAMPQERSPARIEAVVNDFGRKWGKMCMNSAPGELMYPSRLYSESLKQ